MSGMEADPKPPKEPYEPPELLEISLTAEEVMAVGCKRRPGQTNVNRNVCGLGICNRQGS